MKVFTSNSQKIGKLGEDVACIFLVKKGFRVIERNYTRKWGEIDIVADKNKKIYFIEVKSVSCSLENINGDVTRETSFFRPEENMHPQKMKRLARTIETYLIHNKVGNTPWEFNVLLVFLDQNARKARVKVLENIVL